MRKFRIPPVHRLIVSVFAALLLLGVLELTGLYLERTRAKGPNGWTLVGSRRLALERFGDGQGAYYLFSPNRSYKWEGIEVQINSYGIRGPEFDSLKDPAVGRVLNLGDSIPFGWEIAFENTYGSRIEAYAADQSPEAPLQLVTVGIPGWTPQMAYNFFLQEGQELEPDLVILAITLVNDIYGGGPRVAQAGSLTDWLRDNTYAWPAFTTEARLLLAELFGPQFMPLLNPPTEPQAYFPLTRDDPRWEDLWGNVEAMHDLCESHGIHFVAVLFPTAMQLNEHQHPDLPQTIMGKLARETGVTMVDLLPVYREECRKLGPSACLGLENELFADVWMHPNARGHELAAEAILPVVLSQLEDN